MAGQADRLMRFLTPGTASATPSAPVGFGRRRREAAEGGAGADRDRGRRVAADLAGDLEGRPAADRAVGAVGPGRDRALDDGDVLALVVLDGLGEVLLGLVAGGRHDRLVVVDREHVEDDLGDRRARSPAGTTRCCPRSPGTRARRAPASRSSGSRAAIVAAALCGSASAAAIVPQKPMKSRRETPLRSSSSRNQLLDCGMGDASFRRCRITKALLSGRRRGAGQSERRTRVRSGVAAWEAAAEAQGLEARALRVPFNIGSVRRGRP